MCSDCRVMSCRCVGECRVQEECSRHGLVMLWARVQRAGGAARGEEGELQGIGERARGQAGGDARAW